MAIKPILFNTEMVRAILDGRKTCTRRIIKPQLTAHYGTQCVKPPYQPEDVLYVRETWGIYAESWLDADYFMYKADYPADVTTYTHQDGTICDLPRWRPSIHMPKEAARIWLKVTDVKVERLQEINEDEAKAEGANWKNGKNVGVEEKMRRTAVERFSEIWDSTIKKSDLDRYGWQANPLVWAISFERCEKPEVV